MSGRQASSESPRISLQSAHLVEAAPEAAPQAAPGLLAPSRRPSRAHRRRRHRALVDHGGRGGGDLLLEQAVLLLAGGLALGRLDDLAELDDRALDVEQLLLDLVAASLDGHVLATADLPVEVPDARAYL